MMQSSDKKTRRDSRVLAENNSVTTNDKSNKKMKLGGMTLIVTILLYFY